MASKMECTECDEGFFTVQKEFKENDQTIMLTCDNCGAMFMLDVDKK